MERTVHCGLARTMLGIKTFTDLDFADVALLAEMLEILILCLETLDEEVRHGKELTLFRHFCRMSNKSGDRQWHSA